MENLIFCKRVYINKRPTEIRLRSSERIVLDILLNQGVILKEGDRFIFGKNKYYIISINTTGPTTKYLVSIDCIRNT